MAGVFTACRNCGEQFERKRDDHFFCSGKCVAAYYRAYPDPEDIHAPKTRVLRGYCETCGTPFEYNEYAARTGQRKPKFCSSKCRQKAYRDRNGVSENRDYRTRQTPPPPPPPRPPPPPPPRARPRPVRDWAYACSLLGLDGQHTDNELKKAYREKMKEWHPDVNHAPDATRKAQDINWAFNYLRRH